MGATSSGQIAYRSILTRSFEDQQAAMNGGYNSVLELYVDELSQALVLLQERIEKIERRLPYKEFAPADPED